MRQECSGEQGKCTLSGSLLWSSGGISQEEEEWVSDVAEDDDDDDDDDAGDEDDVEDEEEEEEVVPPGGILLAPRGLSLFPVTAAIHLSRVTSSTSSGWTLVSSSGPQYNHMQWLRNWRGWVRRPNVWGPGDSGEE